MRADHDNTTAPEQKPLSRRAAMVGISAVAAVPALALTAAAADTEADVHAAWAERAAIMVESDRLSAEWDRRYNQMPAWAKSGPTYIGNVHKPSDCGWPEMADPPRVASEQVVRVRWAPHDVQEMFRVMLDHAMPRDMARAYYRQMMRKVVARIREKRQVYKAVGLGDAERRLDEVYHVRAAVEENIRAMVTPGRLNALAAATLIEVDDPESCDDAERRLAALVLTTIRPNLSGAIADDAGKMIAKLAEVEAENEPEKAAAGKAVA